MEIAKLSANGLRIKGKKATLLLDVTDVKKTDANAYLFLKEDAQKIGYTTDGVLIYEPGDYEICGVKISVSRYANLVCYELIIDGIHMLIANASSITSGKEKMNEQQMLLLYADTVIDQSAITNLSPMITISYGEKATDLAKSLGKGLGKKDTEEGNVDAEIKPVEKFTAVLEKLPSELLVVLLE